MKDLEHKLYEFHKWRATTTLMLMSHRPDHDILNGLEHLIEDIIDEATEALRPMMKLVKDLECEPAHVELNRKLCKLIYKAIQLDLELHQQRPWIYCEQGDHARSNPSRLHGFPFDSRSMEAETEIDKARTYRSPDTESLVALVVQPALMREGNEYGEGYSMPEVICKAKVVLGRDIRSRDR